MGTSSEMVLLLVLMASMALAQNLERDPSEDEYGGDYENDPRDILYPTDYNCTCLTEIQYRNISSLNTENITENFQIGFTDIKDDLNKLATIKYLNKTNNLINENLLKFEKNLDQTGVKIDDLVDMMSNGTAESKEILNMLNATTINAKTDVETLKDMLGKLATKSAIDLLQGTVYALPTKDTIHNHTQDINDKFTTVVEQLENNVTGLAQQLDIISMIKFVGVEDKLKNNAEQLVKILDTLSTFEDLKKLMATKESLETLQDKLNSLSKEDTVINLTHILSNEIANKEDLQEIKANITTSISEIERELLALKGTVDAVSTKDIIHNYTQDINEKFTTLVELMENNVTGLTQAIKTHFSNKTPDLELEDEFQNNAELMKKLDELKQHLTKLVNKNDIENITNLIESLDTKESLETLHDKLNSLCKEDTVKSLTNVVSNQIANKEDVSDIKEMLQKLQNKQEEENNKIKELIANVTKSSNCLESSIFTEQIDSLKKKVENKCSIDNIKEELGGIEERLLTRLENITLSMEERLVTHLENITLSTEERLLTHLENISLSVEERLLRRLENITFPEKKNSCSSPIIEEKQNCRAKKRCTKKGGTCMKQNECNATVLEGLCDKKQYAKQGCVCCAPKTAGTCEDTVFLNTPNSMDVCASLVEKHLCDSSTLYGFHCCSSCVAAQQITSDGPHRYVNAPRKVDYYAFISEATKG